MAQCGSTSSTLGFGAGKEQDLWPQTAQDTSHKVGFTSAVSLPFLP